MSDRQPEGLYVRYLQRLIERRNTTDTDASEQHWIERRQREELKNRILQGEQWTDLELRRI